MNQPHQQCCTLVWHVHDFHYGFDCCIKKLQKIQFGFQITAYGRLNRFDDWEKLVNARLQKQPDEAAYILSTSELASYRGQFDKAREIIKSMIDKGQASSEDMNQYAWYALSVASPMYQDTIDTASRANDLTKNANFGILHTLACVYAAAGKTSQARELLLKSIDTLHLEEPNSQVLFGFGLIAEQYGEFEAAAKLYARSPKPKLDGPGSTYALAQKRLAALRGVRNDATKNGGQ